MFKREYGCATGDDVEGSGRLKGKKTGASVKQKLLSSGLMKRSKTPPWTMEELTSPLSLSLISEPLTSGAPSQPRPISKRRRSTRSDPRGALIPLHSRDGCEKKQEEALTHGAGGSTGIMSWLCHRI